MRLDEIRAEIAKMAKDHKYPKRTKVLMEGLQGLVLHEFVDGAYYTLLGRFPSDEEKTTVLFKLSSGQIDVYDWLELVVQSDECKKQQLDTKELEGEIQKRKQENASKLTIIKRFKRRFAMTKSLWSSEESLQRMERVVKIWEATK